MHNECSVQKYKETKAKTQAKYGCSSMLSFDETERDASDKAMIEDVLCCDSGCLDYSVLELFMFHGLSKKHDVKAVYIAHKSKETEEKNYHL